MTDIVCPEGGEVVVDGRRAVRLRSGRVVWKDERAEVFGEWFGARFAPQYLVTFTHDPRKTARRRLLARGVMAPSEGLVVAESQRAVTHEVFASWVLRFVRRLERRGARPVYAVGGTESFKSGDAHAHLALSVGDEARFGDVAMMHSLWYDRYGVIKAERVREVVDVVRYATKYVFKDIDRGAWLMSPALLGRMRRGVVRLP